LFFTAQVEVYLNVVEVRRQQIQFRLEQGTFNDFTADLKLQDCGAGTLLTYAVQATPNIPIPTVFIQQAMHLELPANMRKMRQVLCCG
jgi:carbon monoxide dehydrogenase subunit G